MIREIIVPTQNTYLLHLPDSLIGKNVEVIAFSNDDISNENTPANKTSKRTIDQAIAFYTKNGVDFSTIEKWSREDLYE